MKIILIGIQGAGKSTQGNLLSEKLGIPYLSSGHIFREMTKQKTKLGRWLKETVNSGALVDDKTTLDVIFEYLSHAEYKKGYILDGFPRTIAQAKTFDKDNGPNKVVLIDVSDKEALWRISGRISDRDDESLQAIRQRIGLFHEFTDPVVGYYQECGKLVHVDGEQPVERVFQDILRKLKG